MSQYKSFIRWRGFSQEERPGRERTLLEREKKDAYRVSQPAPPSTNARRFFLLADHTLRGIGLSSGQCSPTITRAIAPSRSSRASRRRHSTHILNRFIELVGIFTGCIIVLVRVVPVGFIISADLLSFDVNVNDLIMSAGKNRSGSSAKKKNNKKKLDGVEQPT